MASLNSIMLIGHAGKDPEVRTFEGGNKIATFSLAVSERYTDRNGQSQENTEWFSIIFNGKQAELVEKVVKKGSLLYIGGKIRTRKWTDQQGQQHSQTEVIGLSIQFLDKQQNIQSGTQMATPTVPSRPQYQAPAPQQFSPAPARQTPPTPPAPPQYQAPAPQYPPQYQPQDDGPDLPF